MRNPSRGALPSDRHCSDQFSARLRTCCVPKALTMSRNSEACVKKPVAHFASPERTAFQRKTLCQSNNNKRDVVLHELGGRCAKPGSWNMQRSQEVASTSDDTLRIPCWPSWALTRSTTRRRGHSSHVGSCV